ncbi:uncharacterized protein MELLADRAFT_105306 [Melampsora larici-populina 98AG31]|uniref:Uncharacterized protein n=1 Tax=Melampsora larici-populina (strain 98AG31 / pathotype 3-4-7) TaxID=747676 RepID=F4RHP1_MELLP|nr:uncharacterized protein MELLADRAFT_105306 [Melampsora larici-populina 98AG31]EGG08097.1 hypothetical protein MELLADRAFT_105306 [Melampsora larici-populina 98AG31]
MNIFTRDEQEKLGEYGIRLEKTWSQDDQVELYKAWGSRIVKGILESQAIQIIWLYKDTFMALDEMEVMVQNSLSKEYKDLTQELVTSIKSLDEDFDSLEKLCDSQRQMNYGIYDPLNDESISDEVDGIIFWVKHLIIPFNPNVTKKTDMPFYLEMISTEETRKSQSNLSILIEETDENLLDSIMEEFLITSKRSNDQKNVIFRFLEFALTQSDDEDLNSNLRGALGVMLKEAEQARHA